MPDCDVITMHVDIMRFVSLKITHILSELYNYHPREPILHLSSMLSVADTREAINIGSKQQRERRDTIRKHALSH